MWLDTSGIWFYMLLNSLDESMVTAGGECIWTLTVFAFSLLTHLFTWLMVLMVYFSVLVFLSGSIKDHFGFTPRKHLQGTCIFFSCRLYAKGFQGKDQGMQKNGLFVEANNLIWVFSEILAQGVNIGKKGVQWWAILNSDGINCLFTASSF